jgi:hypothetical protein
MTRAGDHAVSDQQSAGTVSCEPEPFKTHLLKARAFDPAPDEAIAAVKALLANRLQPPAGELENAVRPLRYHPASRPGVRAS